MDQRLIRIRELIDQKEAIDTELASLIGGSAEQPKRGRPRKSDQASNAQDAADGQAQESSTQA